jgi:hypothetical protein
MWRTLGPSRRSRRGNIHTLISQSLFPAEHIGVSVGCWRHGPGISPGFQSPTTRGSEEIASNSLGAHARLSPRRYAAETAAASEAHAAELALRVQQVQQVQAAAAGERQRVEEREASHAVEVAALQQRVAAMTSGESAIKATEQQHAAQVGFRQTPFCGVKDTRVSSAVSRIRELVLRCQGYASECVVS